MAMAFVALPSTPESLVPPEGGEGRVVASGASAARPLLFISASLVSPTLQTGTVLTRGRKRLGQVSIGELWMPLQFFGSLVKGSIPEAMVGRCFFESETPSFALSAAQRPLRSESSSPAPRNRESSRMV